MSITVTGGGVGNITIETDPTALKLTGGTLTGLLYVSTNGLRNPLNQNFVIDAYNDTGAGTHNYFNFNPYGGGLELPDNSAGIKFDSVGGQNISKGSFNSNRGGYNGISLVCANNYELNWQSGYLKNVYNNSVADINVESKVVVNTGAGNVPLNIGSGITPTTSVAGDIWISSGSIRYKDAGGTERIVADINRGNTFTSVNTFQSSTSNPTVTINSTGSGPALKLTNTGSGDCVRVEDESPESTPFVINNSGRVGIGVAPDGAVALSVDSTGIKFNNTIFNPTGTQVALVPYTLYDKEILITVNAVNYAILARIV